MTVHHAIQMGTVAPQQSVPIVILITTIKHPILITMVLAFPVIVRNVIPPDQAGLPRVSRLTAIIMSFRELIQLLLQIVLPAIKGIIPALQILVLDVIPMIITKPRILIIRLHSFQLNAKAAIHRLHGCLQHSIITMFIHLPGLMLP